MISVASLLLIVVAVVLLAIGLLGGSNTYLVASILASLLAAVALIAGSRRQMRADAIQPVTEPDDDVRVRRRSRRTELVHAGAGGRGDDAEPPVPPAVDEYSDRDEVARTATRETALLELDRRSGLPHQPIPERTEPERYGDDAPDAIDDAGSDAGSAGDEDEFDDEDPPDEPPAQYVAPADAARVARMTSEVVVVDGRPRYHLPGCRHLDGREYEALPVGEAVELGFTPCSRCEPDSALLAHSRRV